jgi:DNA replication licensing factor MCM6
VDRHLAEHIVGIHQFRDEAVEPEFTTEQLQRYIRFAKTFKPEFNSEAKEVLVQKYKELRSDDAQGGIGRNSYRITVRQLESMIRLSEAIAKANCVDEITPIMVNEAFNLLRQSIISVEKDDVDVDEEDEDITAAVTRNRERDSPMADADDNGDDDGDGPDDAPVPAQGKRTKITYDKYMKILNLLVHHINEDELTGGEGMEGEALIQWYLNTIEDDLSGEEDYHVEMALVRKVIKRMVKVCFRSPSPPLST